VGTGNGRRAEISREQTEKPPCHPRTKTPQADLLPCGGCFCGVRHPAARAFRISSRQFIGVRFANHWVHELRAPPARRQKTPRSPRKSLVSASDGEHLAAPPHAARLRQQPGVASRLPGPHLLTAAVLTAGPLGPFVLTCTASCGARAGNQPATSKRSSTALPSRTAVHVHRPVRGFPLSHRSQQVTLREFYLAHTPGLQLKGPKPSLNLNLAVTPGPAGAELEPRLPSVGNPTLIHTPASRQEPFLR
jgi:hypothetical protein